MCELVRRIYLSAILYSSYSVSTRRTSVLSADAGSASARRSLSTVGAPEISPAREGWEMWKRDR